MYLRSIAHYITHDDVQLTVKNLMNPNFYHGQIKELVHYDMATTY